MNPVGEHPGTALEQRETLRRGDVTARELTVHALERLEATRDLGAFVSTNHDLALHDAAAADRLIAQTPASERHTLPPLLGLPTAHKDLVQVAGFTTTHGSAAVPHLTAKADDPIAADVRLAGAVCIGKTQVPEFGIAGYSENLVAPPARNPFDPARTAGGSSGGTAGAIAAGVIAAAIGSDAGGSIRIPSAACGLVGLKPGRGTVPADRLLGLVDEAGTPRMAVSGPMARTARDAALFFDAVMGAADEPALRAVERASGLPALRVGVSFASPFEPQLPTKFDDDARTAVRRAVATLTAAGHTVEAATFDYGGIYGEAFTTVWTQALTRIEFAKGAEAQLSELAAWFLTRAREASPERVMRAIVDLREFARRARSQWAHYDVVLTPALAHIAPAIGEFWSRGPAGDYELQCDWAPQTSLVNVVGLPAITVPSGADAAGLPHGVQLIGRAGSEIQLLQLAEQLVS